MLLAIYSAKQSSSFDGYLKSRVLHGEDERLSSNLPFNSNHSLTLIFFQTFATFHFLRCSARTYKFGYLIKRGMGGTVVSPSYFFREEMKISSFFYIPATGRVSLLHPVLFDIILTS